MEVLLCSSELQQNYCSRLPCVDLLSHTTQYIFQFIKTPVFIANSLYDTAQLAGLLGLECLPPNCSDAMMKFFFNFRNVNSAYSTSPYCTFMFSIQQFLDQLAPALATESTGVFADSCLVHCQTLTDNTWTQFLVGGQSMRDTFSDWYFDRSSGKTKEVDCVFPCNPTCPDPQTSTQYGI